MGGEIQVPIERLAHARGLALPRYQTPGAAGMDLMAAIAAPLVLAPGERAPVPTGIRVALPPGTEAQIRPRSGLALHKGLTVANAPGTIDSDYRGEIRVSVINLGREPVVIERGMRIAQMVVAPVLRAVWCEETALEETGRGAGGFGSTGEGSERGQIAEPQEAEKEAGAARPQA
ncbi:MAG: dUTP diphosphatase [Planctomycetes bacterium]|nr:dUTP diphosphatase [Planctomycetota bacterium]